MILVLTINCQKSEKKNEIKFFYKDLKNKPVNFFEKFR